MRLALRSSTVLLAVLALAAPPAFGQDTIPIPAGDSNVTVIAPPVAVDSVTTDSASAPPVTKPTPTEFTLKGWFQAFVNEYALALLIFLSSFVTMWTAKKWPTVAKFETPMKLAVMFGGAMGLYAIIRWIGGTVPDDVMRIVLDGIGPVIAAVFAAAGVGNFAKQTKTASAEARAAYR